MISFFAHLLIILSIVGIAVIILRKVPGVQKSPYREVAKKILEQGWRALRIGGRQVWRFVLEVKELSKKGARFASLPKSLPHITFSAKHLPFFKPADTATFFLAQAQDCLEREDYLGAEQKFIKAIEKDPHNEEAFSGLGKLYLLQNKLTEAIETYKFLVKHHPDNESYFASLGRAYHNKKQFEQAVDAYEQAIVLDPGEAKQYVNLGQTLEAMTHLEEAILNYRKAVDLEKDNTQFLMVLAEALTKKEDRQEAEDLLGKILKLDPTNQVAREKLMQLKF